MKPAPPPPLVRAAEYVRMSMDQSKYSIANQQAAIREYAADRNMTICRTYSDAGRTGLTLRHRPALAQLLKDVVSGEHDYDVILVYDVSRWGRFQDTDESAHYEYLCRSAKVAVEYCAETFGSDGGPLAAMLKNIKRGMAAEYSRELSLRSHRALCRIASVGLHTGGPAGYGLRRMLLDLEGRPKRILEYTEQKAIQGERVVLAPGPVEEVKAVRRIFGLYVERQLSPRQIASLLNEEGCPSPGGVSWRHEQISYMLGNARYIGTQIYNKRSSKLRSPNRRNERSLWVTTEDAFNGIVPRPIFEAAQLLTRQRRFPGPYAEQDLLDRLRRLLKKHGYLSQWLIRLDRGGPQPRAYRRRFGTIREAFAQIGYTRPRQPRYTPAIRRPKKVAAKTLAKLRKALLASGLTVSVNASRLIATVDNVSVTVAAAPCVLTPVHKRRSWRLRYRRRSHSDFVLLIRMDSENRIPLDFWLLARSMVRQAWTVLRDPQFASWREHRLCTFEAVVRAIRAQVRRQSES